MLKVRGLHTFSSYLSAIPEGALLQADNVVIDKDNVIEPRRGFTQYGTIGTIGTDIAKQLLIYKDRSLAHYNSTIAWDNGSGTFTDYVATFSSVQSGLRMKYIELNGNLYVTTSEGIKKISTDSAANLGSATITNAGGIKAVDVSLTLDQSTTTGFLDPNKEVSYRIVWGTKDINQNLILGAPSYRSVITNQTTEYKNVNITFTVPPDITTAYFYQVYRSPMADFNASGDEMKLVYEDVYVSGTTITVLDQQPSDLRDTGTPLYTNEFSGEGILQSNDRPPVAKDIATYKNTAFFANTRGPYKNSLTLLGLDGLIELGVTSHVGASPATITTTTNHNLTTGNKVVIKGAGAADGTYAVTVIAPNQFTVNSVAATGSDVISVFTSSVTITKGVTSNTYFFVGRPEKTTVTYQTKAATTDGSYFLINAYDDTLKFFIYFDKTGTTPAPTGLDTVGRIPVRVDISPGGIVTDVDVADTAALALEGTGQFYVSDYTTSHTISTANSGFCSSPSSTPGLVSPFAAPSDITIVQKGFGEDAANKYVRKSSFVSPATQIEDTAKSLVAVINKNFSDVVSAFYTPDTSALPGSMYFEAKIIDNTAYTIIANSAATGAMFNADITTALSATNELKPNAIYYSKTYQPEAVPAVNNIDIGPKDKAILRILGLRDSLFIFKEEGIYRLTGDNSTNFTVTLFDNSSILNAPDTAAILNNQIYCLTTQGVATVSETGVSIISRPIENVFTTATSPNYINYSTASFALGYESDRSYIIWLPATATATIASKAYRFNTFTQSWTSWNKDATCGVVNVKLNKSYLGVSDTNLIEIERKNLDRTDYADRQYSLAIGPNSIADNVITLTSVTNINIGDILVQRQYITISQVLRLARKFALDSGVPDTIGNSNKDYYRNFTIATGSNLQDVVSDLITQLNSDLGSAFLTSYSSDFATFQTEYNSMIAALNLSPLLLHTNYEVISGTVDYELYIEAKNQNTNQVTVTLLEPVIEGIIVHYTAIQSTVIWAPIAFGDPSMMKHVRQATMLFDNAGILGITIGYNTDLSANFEEATFSMEGFGGFGVSAFSSTTWGGEGTGRPIRTLIPRQKQRCRFIRCRFKHSSAYDKFGIFGISYTYEINSERAYK